jgi:flagellar biosynthetic protein FliR
MPFSFFLLFARFTGFFLLSPLFSQRNIPKSIRLGLALTCSFVLGVPLSQRYLLSDLDPLKWILILFQEGTVGYLLGFLFSLLFEAAAFAGQFVGSLMGFSATELLDPLATSSHPLMARLFALITFALFLILDLHHPLLRLLYESFEVFPPLHYPFTHTVIEAAIQGTSWLFKLALVYAAIPFTLLITLIALFAILSRFLPIFWASFPLLILAGLLSIGVSLPFFAPILERSCAQFWTQFFNVFQNFRIWL